MKWLPWVLLVAMISPFIPVQAQLPASVGEEVPLGPETGERLFVLVMDGTEFNGLSWPNSPLLEAYVGETMTFYVHVPHVAAAYHTFHLHGHPWWDNGQDRFIDNKLLKPGQTHSFSVEAGTIRGNAGDWLYHCHVDNHFDQGMFGIVRVYPYAVAVTGGLDALDVQVHRDGDPVPATEVTLSLDGRPVDAEVDRVATNHFKVHPDLPADTEGQLVIHTDNDLGQSLARLSVSDGGYDLIRHVIPDNAPELLGDQLPADVREDAETPDVTIGQDPTTMEAIQP